MKVRTKFEVCCSFTRSWDKTVYKNWAFPGYAHAPFSPKVWTGFCSNGPYEYRINLKSVASPVPEIGGSQKISGRSWSGMVPSERKYRIKYRTLTRNASEIQYVYGLNIFMIAVRLFVQIDALIMLFIYWPVITVNRWTRLTVTFAFFDSCFRCVLQCD